MITISLLADHPNTIPTLAKWFLSQWPDYYVNRSLEEIERDFVTDAYRDHLPIRLLAFESNNLAGTIVLRDDGTEMLPYEPELGGLYVVESYRGRGIATELVRAGMQVAREQGYETVYATTVAAAGILERLGWEFVETVIHSDGELSLYQCML
ncbi:MAG: GNAT family N-acetyltransferase [Anaerolineales bacterium]